MSDTAFVPAQVFHPTEILRDELLARGWTLDTLTTRLVGSHPHLDPMAAKEWGIQRLAWDLYFGCGPGNDHLHMGEEAARGLERVLGIDADFWLRTEQLWRETPAERRAPVPDLEEWLRGGGE